MNTCLNNNLLKKLAYGDPLLTSRDDLNRHIANCSNCSNRLSSILAEKEQSDKAHQQLGKIHAQPEDSVTTHDELSISLVDTPSCRSELIDESVRRHFETCWIKGQPLVIESCLPASDHATYLATLEELVLIEMELLWKECQVSVGNRGPFVEEYVNRFPILKQTDILTRLVQEEYQIRYRVGDQPSVEEYCQRFTESLPEFRFANLEKEGDDGSNNLGFTAPYCSAPFAPTPVFPSGKKSNGQSPPTIPGYELLEKIGQGGMGIVYKARQEKLQRIVALKMILAGGYTDSEEEARFLQEAELIAQLKHPHFVQIYEFGINPNDGQPFFSLEFLEGGTLAGRMKGEPQTALQAAHMVEMLALAMQVAHNQGVIHRDLKPANVLLTKEGEPRISDFGLAKRLDIDEGRTRTGAIMGTPCYMAPEQAEGRTRDIGPASDIYALGTILYEMLTGRPPFKGDSAWDTVQMVIGLDPVPPKRLNFNVPQDIETICLKCLEKNSDKRYRSCAALADDLHRWCHGEPIFARPVGVLERATKWTRRNPWKASAVSAFVLLLFVVASSVFMHLAQQAHVLRNELKRLQQANLVRASVAQFLLEAQQAEDQKNWTKALTLHEKALAALAANSELHADALQTDLRLRLQQAMQGEKALEREQKSRPYYHDAIFHETSFTGLELSDNRSKARQAARVCLANYQLDEDHGDEVSLLENDQRYLPEADFDQLVARCYELLLVWAEVEAVALPGQSDPSKNQAGAKRGLQILLRAERLGAKYHIDTQTWHIRNARYTAWSKGEIPDLSLPRGAPPQPINALDWFLKGLESYHREQFELTRMECLQALTLQKDHYWARFILGLCHLRLENWSAAKVDMTMCLDQRHEFAWPLLMRGFASSELGALYKALTETNQPDDKARREFAAAEADFSMALQRDPDPALHYAGLNNRGVLYLRTQRWDEAQIDLLLAIKLKPEYLTAYINLAKAYEGAKQYDQAVATVDLAIKRSPALAELYDHRSSLNLAREDRQAACADLENAIANWAKGKTPKRLAQVHEILGKLYLESKRHEAALEQFSAALKLNPTSETALRLQAESFLSLDRRKEAADALDKYLALAEKPSAGLCKARGLLHTQHREYAKAVEMYSLSIRQMPNDWEAYSLRGWVYLLLDAARPALNDFAEALKISPMNADARVGKANARVRLRQVQEAVADAEAALAQGPQTDRLLYKVTCVYSLAMAHMNLDFRQSKDRQALYQLERYETMAFLYLKRTLDMCPPEKRITFWREVIEIDPLLTPIRQHTKYTQLSQYYSKN